MKFIYGDEAYTTIEKNVHQTKQHRLTWQIASKGKVKGKAKVIKVDPNQYDNLKTIVDTMWQGDILVTETTEPSIIAACAKAGAIVTNQWWMMSHAAIVSRELWIPCIVGTWCATEMINDGDWIEVDADNGIISIL
jgi:pyruvate,water dikinase